MLVRSYIVRITACVVTLLILTGCGTATHPSLNSAEHFWPSTEPVKNAKKYFRNGNFGLAEKHYRLAVEKTPRSAEAWLGLAASYDQLRRFDLADKAYTSARQLVGDRPSILNNIGYSYILRSDLEKAKHKLLEAYNKDPDNPHIMNNIEILNQSLIENGRAVVVVKKS